MLKFSLHIAARTLRILRRVALAIVLLLFFTVSGVFLSLRYAVLPDIGKYHGDITAAVSKVVGMPVEIGKIEADWKGIGPHLQLSDIRILDRNARTTLALQRVDIVVSWMTLFGGEVRLASLEIDQPDLMVKRDAQGLLQISGMQLGGKPADSPANNNFSGLLLNQSRIVVRGAHIGWLDELKSKPLLEFNQVNLLIENGWNSHRFAMRASPPAELATQLDVRGKLYGKNFDDWLGWSGEIYTQLEYADLPAWKTWLPLPDALRRGKGALRGWLGIEDGKISQVTADLALVDVQTRLAAELPPLDIRVLSGRLGWKDIAQGFEISSRQFSLKLFDNFVVKPTDVFLRLSNIDNIGKSSGEARANLLELDGFGKLLEYLPVERSFKAQFAEFSPKGSISGLQMTWSGGNDKKLHYRLKGRFAELSLQRVGKLPGFSGLSGEVDGNESHGTLTLKSRNLKVDAPQIMPEPLALDTISAKSVWDANGDGLEVKLRNVALSNSDLAGTAYGSYQTMADGPGKLDLNVHLSHASVPHAGKYIPLIAIGDNARKWLNHALLEGVSQDFNLRIKGNLNDFPFADNRKGIFKIQARARDVALEYDAGWPRIEKGSAELLIQGKELAVNASVAMTAGVRLKNVKVQISDVMRPDLALAISGEAEGAHAHALGFVHSSPVRGYLDGFTDDIVAHGSGKLKLKLDIPLGGSQPVKVAGDYQFTDSEIEFGKSLPALRKVNGNLLFSESGVSTQNIVAQVLGGPARLLVDSGEGGAIHLKAEGKANLKALRNINPHPALQKLSGEPAWNLDIAVKDKLSKVTLSSNLLGLQSDLPAPFAKQADASVPLRLEMKDISQEQRSVAVQYGAQLNANLVGIRDDEGNWEIRRGIVNFGNVPQKADRNGLWVIGTLPQLSLDGWSVLAGADTQDTPVSIAGADLLIQKVTGYGNQINDLHIKASRRQRVLSAQLLSRELNGELSWQPGDSESDDYAEQRGRLRADLRNLDLALGTRDAGTVEPLALNSQTAGSMLADSQNGGSELPALDIRIEKLNIKGRALGRLELAAQQNEEGYQVERLRLTNPDGVLNADGLWKMSEEAPQTKINLKLDISNAGNILGRSGFPNSVRNGSGKLEGSFNWTGTPAMFNKAGLNGNMSLDTGKGQFMQIDPGIGKLLSILSLQALPKRIALDFEDVFSKGFEFDSIKGSAQIRQGVIFTDNLKIEGSSAKVLMVGQIDLANETQNLQVHIVPTIGNTAALVTWLVTTPVIGAGVFIASKILGDPLGQLASFQYNISGSWVDPKVEKAGEKKTENSAEQ